MHIFEMKLREKVHIITKKRRLNLVIFKNSIFVHFFVQKNYQWDATTKILLLFQKSYFYFKKITSKCVIMA